MRIVPTILRVAASICLVFSARAEVSLPAILTDHMVIQRGMPVHVWGKAAAGEAVSVAFRGESKAATADSLGRWSVALAPGDAGGPFELTVKGSNTISLRDVLVGEVWVASGQSNMEFPLRRAMNADAEIAAAKYPKIRRIAISRKVSDFPVEDAVAPGGWLECNPENAGSGSAIGYFFARHLQEKLGGVPVGIVESYWGGTPVEAWTSLRALSEDAALLPFFSEWGKAMENWPLAKAQYEKRLAEWNSASGVPKPAVPNMSPGSNWMPAGLYNAMIAPLTRFPIRGAIWYQGESNASPVRAPIYAKAFQGMIRDWRRAWGEGDFPFLWVQLANYKANPSWPEVREAQRQTLSLANTGQAVAIDVGNPNDIHPTNKQDVGLRLALAARAVAYGEKIEFSGPAFRAVSSEGSALRVWFDHTGGGLTAKGGALRGFEIAGADRKFVAADAKIDGSAVVVSSAAVAAPVYVRYGWADNPDCNLYNGEALPASPFRSAE